MSQDTVSMPTERVADMVREQALIDSDPMVMSPDGVDIEVWDTLKEAETTDVRWEDDDLHVWMEDETTISEKIRRSDRHNPAEYRNHPAEVLVSITWGLDPAEMPEVDIEVIEK